MNQKSTVRSTMFAIVAMGIVFSVSGLVIGHTTQIADATKPKHGDDNGHNGNNNANPTAFQNAGAVPAPVSGSSVGSDIEAASGSGIGSLATDTSTAQPIATAQAASSSAACGQVVSGVVNLTANLNCSSGDGIIVGGPNTVINMNGFSITGPGQDSSKVGIMVPNVDNVVVNGPGSISNFQAGVLLTGANGFKINSAILSNNQIGTFMTGAENAQVQQNINANQYVYNSCETSNPSGLCIGR